MGLDRLDGGSFLHGVSKAGPLFPLTATVEFPSFRQLFDFTTKTKIAVEISIRTPTPVSKPNNRASLLLSSFTVATVVAMLDFRVVDFVCTVVV